MMFQLPGKSQQNVGNINLGNLDRWRKELLGYDRPLTEKEKKSKKYKADYAAFGDKMTIPVAPLSDEQIKSKYDAYFNIYDDSGVLLDPEDWTPKSSIIVDPKNSSFDSVIKDKDGNPVYNLNEAQKILAGKVKTDPVTGKKVYRPNHFRNSLFYVDKNGNYHIANAGRPSYDPIRNVMHVDKDTYAKQMYDLTMAELTHGLQNQRYGTKELLKNFLTNAGPGGSRYHRDPRNPKSNLYSDGMGQLSKQIQDYYKKNKSATGGWFPYAEQYVQENIPGYYSDHGKGEFSYPAIYDSKNLDPTSTFNEKGHVYFEPSAFQFIQDPNIPIEDLQKYLKLQPDRKEEGGEILSKKLEEEIDKIMAKEMPLTRKQKLIDKLVSVYNEKSDVKYKRAVL